MSVEGERRKVCCFEESMPRLQGASRPALLVNYDVDLDWLIKCGESNPADLGDLDGLTAIM